MAETKERKNRKPEIEILPVREGVQAVDDWYPVYGLNDKGESILEGWDIPDQYKYLKVQDKNIIIEFDKFLDVLNNK